MPIRMATIKLQTISNVRMGSNWNAVIGAGRNAK